MSDSPSSPESTNELQFTSAERADARFAATSAGLTCLACGQPITATYFALADKILCPSCCALLNSPPSGNSLTRFIKAALFGLGAGLVGALVWFVIRRAASVEIGLVALLVGFMVGKAVRKGSGNQGGLGYQILAVMLTYCCIAANYVPDVMESMLNEVRQNRAAGQASANPVNGGAADRQIGDPQKAAAPKLGADETMVEIAVILAFALEYSLELPFRGGAQNLIGLIIIAIALWEAWKLNARRKLPISGPYRVGMQSAQ